jgi:hypothetical protein
MKYKGNETNVSGVENSNNQKNFQQGQYLTIKGLDHSNVLQVSNPLIAFHLLFQLKCIFS